MKPTNPQLIADLKRDEGRRDKPYKDTRGFTTIGYGHNLDAEGLCEAALTAQLEHDIAGAIGALDRALPWWTDLPEPAQRVLVNLCFNMGIRTLMTFRQTLRYLQARQFRAAARALMESAYARQVGARAERLRAILESLA